MNDTQITEKLRAAGQLQLLRFYDELDDREKQSLKDQIIQTDFSYLSRFSSKDNPASRGVITPLKAMTLSEIACRQAEYEEAGLKALASGRIAAVCLAGGMGTRLGFNGPKGCFDIGITHPVYIFQRLIENLMLRVKSCGRWIWLFFMTSENNDEATRAFLEEHKYFGYDPSYIRFFRQEMAPAVGEDGQVLLETKSRIAVSPNGNGGWFRSMQSAGFISLLQEQGVDFLNVFAVDNVLQNICDPVFIGAVLDSGCASGSKVVRKNSPDERVGAMCLEDGRTSVIEYYEMSEAMRHETGPDGERLYNFGVTLNYLFRIPDLVKAADDKLPVHFAHKKIECVDEEGNRVMPDQPNGWKFEYFIFDILHILDGCLPFEIERNKEFAPIKNASGTDSPDSARELCRMNGIIL